MEINFRYRGEIQKGKAMPSFGISKGDVFFVMDEGKPYTGGHYVGWLGTKGWKKLSIRDVYFLMAQTIYYRRCVKRDMSSVKELFPLEN